jgi:hypothetical protein
VIEFKYYDRNGSFWVFKKEPLLGFELLKMSLSYAVVFAVFHAFKMKTWGIHCQITRGPFLSCISVFGSLNELLIPIGPLFQLQHNFLAY